ncbi:MAG: hypothetical protein BSOLF_0072 [Candidatus Carbobacillus altaicus]|uniref:Uncharacterized protein n=1 Tax=Candidatus Carbonibacillus altaicus TaxID=2163959 RepID=A0A2R6XXJ6_9BACL|nr:MAG: hypothetical protein BSOLF_0072 [Candidatus Carbobacillus altaicus]
MDRLMDTYRCLLLDLYHVFLPRFSFRSCQEHRAFLTLP